MAARAYGRSAIESSTWHCPILNISLRSTDNPVLLGRMASMATLNGLSGLRNSLLTLCCLSLVESDHNDSDTYAPRLGRRAERK